MHDMIIVHVPYMFNTNPPMAAPLLKACLAQHGIKAKAVDLNIQFLNSDVSTDSIIAWMQDPSSIPGIEEFRDYKSWMLNKAIELADSDAPVIGISVFTKDSQRAAEDIIAFIKERNPRKKIIVGGLGANVLQSQWDGPWYEILHETGLTDAVIIGEGEHAIVKVIKDDLRGIINATQLSSIELDFVPMPDFSDYDLTDYKTDIDDDSFAIPITASKGCVRDCTFCDVGKHWPRFHARNGESVAREIMHYHESYGFRYFRFTDSLINGNVKEFRLMNSRLAAEIPGRIKYRGQFICKPRDQMPASDFSLMADAGAYRVQIGIESGSESVRHHMRKKFSNADIEYCTYQLHRNGIRQSWFVFVGYPTETEDDFNETLRMIEKYKHLAVDQMLQIIPTGVFQLLDGTPMTEKKMLDELEIEQHMINGYQTYNWTSKRYPDNTFEARANRFKRLVSVCREHGLIGDFEDMVDGHLKMINNQGMYHG